MDVVLLHHLDANRLEGTQPDMQGDLRRLDAAFTDALQDRGCEVQSGSRCGDRAGSPGINGLVLLAIQRCVGAIDVGGKGNVADALQHREKLRHRVKLQMALAKIPASDDPGCEFVGQFGRIPPEVDALSHAKFAAGVYKRFP